MQCSIFFLRYDTAHDILPAAGADRSLGADAQRWAHVYAAAAAAENLDVDYLDVAVTASNVSAFSIGMWTCTLTAPSGCHGNFTAVIEL